MTFFVDEFIIKPRTKIEYIVENYLGPETLFYWPAISTLVLLTIAPLLSNLSYWLSLNFELQRIRFKEARDGKVRLTVQQSTALRNEMASQEEKFQKSLASKDQLLQDSDSQLKRLNLEKTSFKILLARYGSNEGKWVDCTEFLNTILNKNSGRRIKLEITNESLQIVDPAPAIWKDFQVVYQSYGEIRTLFASEGDEILLEGDTHKVEPGNRTKKWSEWLKETSPQWDAYFSGIKTDIKPDRRRG